MPEFVHKPVLLAEVLEALRPHPGGRYADGTLGGAGHAAAILEASSPTGWVSGCDRDGAAVAAAQARLAKFAGRFEIRRGNFAELAEWIPPGSCDGVLLDLGVSSPQLDEAGRGFSFMHDGPLDMRMDTRQGITAADLLNRATADELAKIFWELADERDSRRMARAIVHDRGQNPFRTTRQLAELIGRISPRRGSKAHPATKVFQALRLAVNDELGSLKRGLDGAWQILKPGGRLAVLTFHSIEDRVVKEFGRARARDYTFTGLRRAEVAADPPRDAGPETVQECLRRVNAATATQAGGVDVPELRAPRPPEARILTRKAIKPGAAEIAENPRSRSAQLRVMEKI